jgi:hypothetical protein
MSKLEPSGEVPANANVSDSQGVLVGSGSQYNTWAVKQPLDPSAIGDLNPHVAVARLQPLSHDELVDFFVRASPESVCDLLEVFLEVDLAKVVATLGDISRRKATALIGAVGKDYILGVLGDLPGAADAIARRAAKSGWADAEPLEAFSEGYARRYNNGRVFWSPSSGVVRSTGAIGDYWTEGETDWGFPVKDQEPAPTSPYGTTGVRQEFQPSTVYSCKHGVFRITDARCYENEGGSGGWLGFPVSERRANGQLATRQMFEGGSIYSSVPEGQEGPRSFAVRRLVADVLPDHPWSWHPLSKEAATVSSSGAQGSVQHFELMRMGIDDETGESVVISSYDTAVYSFEIHPSVIVAERLWSYYRNLGAEKSWLGFPANLIPPRSTVGLGGQYFEEGTIYWQPGVAPLAVTNAIRDLVREDSKVRARVGYPVTEEQPLGVNGSDRIQFFHGGVVTKRAGMYEIWLRPEATPAPPPT